jgi:hypothetical protein
MMLGQFGLAPLSPRKCPISWAILPQRSASVIVEEVALAGDKVVTIVFAEVSGFTTSDDAYSVPLGVPLVIVMSALEPL